MPTGNDPFGYRFALNPIQWYATEDGWLDPAKGPDLSDLLGQIRRAGYRHVHAQPPATMTVAEYAAVLDHAGLQPAPGYLSMGLPEHGVDIDTSLDLARRAAAQQAELGLSDMFIACRMSKDAARVRRPAIGADADPARSEMILSLIDRASAILVEEGVRGALHPHVGTWVETEAEARSFLDALPATQLGFGPDTGHLAWAGADVIGLIEDYRDRIPVMHIKDCVLAVAESGKAKDLTYRQVVVEGLWAQPGDGDLDLDGMLAALGPEFDGWLIAEVDFPALPPFESACASAIWLSSRRRASAGKATSRR